jgi:glutathione synthase/RimK-type ligase-like ATP-grasp enzyme
MGAAAPHPRVATAPTPVPLSDRADSESGRVTLVIDAAKASASEKRLWPVAEALAEVGLASAFVAYDDHSFDAARSQLLNADCALVWVDPISGDGRERTRLDALLREIAARGVVVSAHPDTILSMGTKEVLYRTRELGWGCDTHLYETTDEFRSEFPKVLTELGARVLKPYRGNGGIGVHKVELVSQRPATPSSIVRVQGARLRDEVADDMPLQAFMDSYESIVAGADGSFRLIDQPFQPRITDGIIRCYLVKNEVVGFARQYPEARELAAASTPRLVFGLPSAKTMFAGDEPSLHTLRELVEFDWLPAMQAIVGLDAGALPVLWDADFLLGPATESGEDTYVLCEINVSSVLPFPPQAPGAVARATLAALSEIR